MKDLIFEVDDYFGESYLLRDEIESISDEEMGRRITYMKRKLEDNVFRYNGKWTNKMIHGINEKEK